MLKNKTLGVWLAVIGVLANNYVYLHDLVTGVNDGMIELGWKAWTGIAVTLLVAAIGLAIAARSPASA